MIKQKKLPAEKRKRVILRAAIEVFSESNYRVARISDIASRAGITDPMIYKFYKSKSELFQEILQITSNKTRQDFLKKDFFENEKLKSKKDFRMALKNSLWSYFSSMERYRKELKIYFQAISEVDEPEIQKVLRDSYKSYASLYQSILQQGKDQGTLALGMETQTIAWDIVGFTIHQSTLFVMGFYSDIDAQILLNRRIQEWIPEL